MKKVPEILRGYGEASVRAIKQSLQKVNATGKTINSVRYESDSKSLTIYARPFTSVIESGRRPTTKGPSPEMIENLTAYARARGMKDPNSAAWGIAKTINKEGDKTFKRGGRDVYTNTVTKLTTQMIKELSKNFTLQFTQQIKKGFVKGSFMLALFMCSCGSIQTINGVKIKDKRQQPNPKAYIMSIALSLGFGYWLGQEVLPQKNK